MAYWKLAAAVAALVVLVVALMQLFPSREERLWDFIDATRDALMTGTEQEFAASFDPAVKYEAPRFGTKGGLAEVRRDWKRYRSMGLPRPSIVNQKAELDPEGADVRIEAVIVAGLRPIAQASARLRVVESDGRWRIVAVRWE